MFRRFFSGRYGNDQLNYFLWIIALLFDVIAFFTVGTVRAILSLLAFIFLALVFCRMLSRNYWLRRRENDVFLKYWNKFKGLFKGIVPAFNRLKDRKHKYFKCPNCNSRLRVPRGRGEITVNCPRCHHRFDKKT